jgi:hypothetical protein
VLTGAALFYRVLLCMLLHLDNDVESKRECKSDNEAKKSCKFMTPDEKIKITDKLRGGMCAVAVGLTLLWYFILMLNFPMILMILLSLFRNKYHYSIFMFFSCLFTLASHDRVPVSPLIPHDIKFVQRGFTERAAFEEPPTLPPPQRLDGSLPYELLTVSLNKS